MMAAEYPVEDDFQECPHGVSLTVATLVDPTSDTMQGACQKTLAAENTRVYPADLTTVRKLLPAARKAATVARIAKQCGPWVNLRTSFILLAIVVVALEKIEARVPWIRVYCDWFFWRPHI
jgi:hypothetical protein